MYIISTNIIIELHFCSCLDGNATVAVRLNVDTSGRFILVWSYAGPEGNLTSYIYNIICQIYN